MRRKYAKGSFKAKKQIRRKRARLARNLAGEARDLAGKAIDLKKEIDLFVKAMQRKMKQAKHLKQR